MVITWIDTSSSIAATSFIYSACLCGIFFENETNKGGTEHVIIE